MGFEVEPFGGDTFLVRAAPASLAGEDPLRVLEEIASSLAERRNQVGEELEDALVKMVCKRAAIKAGQLLSDLEMRELVRQLEECQSPRTCPHGRPTVIQLPASRAGKGVWADVGRHVNSRVYLAHIFASPPPPMIRLRNSRISIEAVRWRLAVTDRQNSFEERLCLLPLLPSRVTIANWRSPFEVDQERVERELRKAANKVAGQYRIPGFRKGKAPYHIIVQQFGLANLYNEFVEDLGQELFQQAIEQENIEPYAQSSLEDIKLDPLTYTLVVPLDPEVNAGRLSQPAPGRAQRRAGRGRGRKAARAVPRAVCQLAERRPPQRVWRHDDDRRAQRDCRRAKRAAKKQSCSTRPTGT